MGLKRLLCSFSLIFMVKLMMAQSNFALVEHFTNSWCPVCKNRNPQLFNVIEKYTTNVHHIAYHPPIPYQQCIFYQNNTTENQARTDFYNVRGTPQAFINGSRGAEGNDQLSETKVVDMINAPLRYDIKVTEEEQEGKRQVYLEITGMIAPPPGNLKLFVAIVEKAIDYHSPNGESVHHDVFRKMLPAVNGDTITLPGIGEKRNFTYEYELESGWVEEELYAIAFIQNTTSKEVYASGSKFDHTTTNLTLSNPRHLVNIYPNPTSSILNIQFSNPNHSPVVITNLIGKVVGGTTSQVSSHKISVPVSELPNGIYMVKGDGFVRKFIKSR